MSSLNIISYDGSVKNELPICRDKNDQVPHSGTPRLSLDRTL